MQRAKLANQVKRIIAKRQLHRVAVYQLAPRQPFGIPDLSKLRRWLDTHSRNLQASLWRTPAGTRPVPLPTSNIDRIPRYWTAATRNRSAKVMLTFLRHVSIVVAMRGFSVIGPLNFSLIMSGVVGSLHCSFHQILTRSLYHRIHANLRDGPANRYGPSST